MWSTCTIRFDLVLFLDIVRITREILRCSWILFFFSFSFAIYLFFFFIALQRFLSFSFPFLFLITNCNKTTIQIVCVNRWTIDFLTWLISFYHRFLRRSIFLPIKCHRDQGLFYSVTISTRLRDLRVLYSKFDSLLFSKTRRLYILPILLERQYNI